MKKFIVGLGFLGAVFGLHGVQKIHDASVIQGVFNKTKDFLVRRSGYSQTLAQVSVDAMQKKIKGNLSGFADNTAVIDMALMREHQYKRMYDVFYTTQSCSRLLQDVMRELYMRKVGAVGALQTDAFQFMRFSYQNARYDQFSTVQDFMKYALRRDGVMFDSFDNNGFMIAADVSLFGNPAAGIRSTWMSFVNPHTDCRGADEKNRMRNMLVELLASYGYSAAYVEKLLELNKYLVNKQGKPLSDLIQIFIPEAIVDQNGYCSAHAGIPYDQDYLDQLLKTGRINMSSSLDNFRRAITDFSRLYKRSDEQVVAAVESLIKKVDMGAFKLEQYLYEYRTLPDQAKGLEYAQARLLVTNKVLLNPASGLLIYRYSQIDPAQEAAYKRDLERILQQMDIEKQARDAILIK